MVSNQDIVKLIQAESKRVRDYLNELPVDALNHATPCERWAVGDIIAHLVWFAETYGGMMERGLKGDLSPPEGFPDSGGVGGGGSGELYAVAAINTRRELGPGLFSALNERYDWLDEMLAGIGPDDWERSCYHTSRLRSVESFLPTIIQELAVHEWDIRSSLGPAPALSAASLPVLMEKIPLGKAPTNRRPWRTPFPARPNSSPPIRCSFVLKGPGELKFDVVVDDDIPRLEANKDDPADLYLTGDTNTFILIIYGRLSLESAMSDGSFTAEGDMALVGNFDRWLAAN